MGFSVRRNRGSARARARVCVCENAGEGVVVCGGEGQSILQLLALIALSLHSRHHLILLSRLPFLNQHLSSSLLNVARQ